MLVRSTYLNRDFFQRYTDKVNSRNLSKEKEARFKSVLSLVAKLPPIGSKKRDMSSNADLNKFT